MECLHDSASCDQVRMEKKLSTDLYMEPSEGGLKELVLRWFTETQAPLILSNGNFPDWFQGFAARKDTEDLLRDKALGCFLIRLSDKAIGYILSYKGHDRCRHFVISQNPDGQFAISGDCQTYSSLTELIEYYKVSPIQPFGEYLTCSCYEVDAGELYDVVNYQTKEQPGVSVQALRTLWDQKTDHPRDPDNNQQQTDPPTLPPPALPPKSSKSRKLTGVVSADSATLSQALPPVPRRGLLQGFSQRGFLPATTSPPGEAGTNPNRSERPRDTTNPALMFDRESSTHTDPSGPGDLCPAGTMYSELMPVESRSRSLPRLNMEEDEEEDGEYSNQLSSLSLSLSSSYSPIPLKKVTCHTYSLHDPRLGSSWSEQQADGGEMFKSNPLYHTCERPGSAHQGRTMYAELAQRPPPSGLPDDTYEQVPRKAIPGNTYESLEEMKNKSKHTWGKNNMKWKKFLPEYRKK